MGNAINPDGTLISVKTDAKPAEILTEKLTTEPISETAKAAIGGVDSSVASNSPIRREAVKQFEPTDPLTIKAFEVAESVLSAIAKPESLTVIEKLIVRAVEKNNPEALKIYLISNGGSLDNKNLKTLLAALLVFSAKKGYWNCARVLIEFGGANVNGADVNSENFMVPLKQAIIQENADMIKFLLKKGADIYIKGEVEVVDSFLDSDCEDEECQMVDTPLMLALNQGNKEIIQILTSFSSKYGQTVFMRMLLCEDEEIVKLIINKVDPEFLDQLLTIRDISGYTTFMLAAQNERTFLVLLHALKAGKKDINRMNYDVKNNNIPTPFMLAVKYGYEEALKLMIGEAKADPALLDKLFTQSDQDGNTVFALVGGRKNIAEMLIQALIAADINPNKYLNIQNKDGRTPLMLAVIYGSDMMIMLNYFL